MRRMEYTNDRQRFEDVKVIYPLVGASSASNPPHNSSTLKDLNALAKSTFQFPTIFLAAKRRCILHIPYRSTSPSRTARKHQEKPAFQTPHIISAKVQPILMARDPPSLFSRLPCDLQERVAHFLVPSYGTQDEDDDSDTCVHFAGRSLAHHAALISALKHSLIVDDSRVNLHNWQMCYPNHFHTIRLRTNPRGSTSIAALQFLFQAACLHTVELSSGIHLQYLLYASIRDLSVVVYTSRQRDSLQAVLPTLRLSELSLTIPRTEEGICGVLWLSFNHRFLSEACPFVKRLSIDCAHDHERGDNSECAALVAALAFPRLEKVFLERFQMCADDSVHNADYISSARKLMVRRPITAVKITIFSEPYADLSLEFGDDPTSLSTTDMQLGICEGDCEWSIVIPGGATHIQSLKLDVQGEFKMDLLLQTLRTSPALRKLSLLHVMEDADIVAAMRVVGSHLLSLGISLTNQNGSAAERLCRILDAALEHCRFLHEIRLDLSAIREENKIECVLRFERLIILERRLGKHFLGRPFMKIVDDSCGTQLTWADLTTLLLYNKQ